MTGTEVSVRRADPADRDDVEGILDTAMLQTGDVGAAIDRGDVHVAEADGQVVGALVRDGTHIESIAVTRTRRAEGIGRALVEGAAAAVARDVDDPALTAAFRESVRPFWEALGFDVQPRNDRLWGRWELPTRGESAADGPDSE